MQSTELTKTTPILIAGAGAFGLSTALHLVRSGYSEVTVIDPHPVPSPLSAANDINKIIRSEYPIPLYSNLAREAFHAWEHDPLFVPHFHKVGWFTGAASDDERARGIVSDMWATTSAEGNNPKAKFLDNGADLKDIAVQTAGSEKLRSWSGIYNPEAGWAHSGDSLIAVAKELKSRGVRFIHGPDGTFDSLHRDSSGEVDGITVQSGRYIPAEKVILAMGAVTGSKFEVKDALRAYGYALAMIQLESQEAKLYKDMPVLHSKAHGYIFEPSVDGRMKFALPGRYAWYGYGGVSRPEAAVSSYNNIPQQCRDEMRELLSIFLPQLADRPFAYEQLCWDADSVDDHFLIGYTPDSNKVLAATGGSYHGFKFFPILGKYIVDALEGNLAEDLRDAWAWRADEMAGVFESRGPNETRVLDRSKDRAYWGVAKL
ncbi:hypothetical protein CI109_100506 [Kwoniella shandongensis]|uniref:Uncharacterized protein n=1 Tax=Kwoniella shandongensis TaxID=1734106 RepID=A0A5M6C4I8_9TREE|nr:uncharacterized protein CI109_001650 [Kwoniella shandongensis]KAA5529711.1 hypothetical protein CI109_001650 [Kwoniella shandongensis]